MGVFFNDWSGPGQTVVDPRKSIRLFWYYYAGQNPDQDDRLQYFRIMWKPVTIKGWTDPSIKSVIVPPTQSYYNLPANSFTLNSAWAWQVEAWVIDKDYNPDVPPGPDVPTGDTILGPNTSLVVDTSGYTMSVERNQTITSGNSGFGNMPQPVSGYSMVPSDPGEYEVRFRVSNGFQWSAYSTPVKLVLYDTRRWVKVGTRWQAVPEWKKTSGVMTRIRK